MWRGQYLVYPQARTVEQHEVGKGAAGINAEQQWRGCGFIAHSARSVADSRKRAQGAFPEYFA
jgi:hypothetical protein